MTAINAAGVAREALLTVPQGNVASVATTARETLLIDPALNRAFIGGVVREVLYEPGTAALAVTNIVCADLPVMSPDRSVSLRYSDDAGASWSNPMTRTIGPVGIYDTNISFRRIGISRNRVIELSWSGPFPTALTGVFLEVAISQT